MRITISSLNPISQRRHHFGRGILHLLALQASTHNPFAVSFDWLTLRAKKPPSGGFFTAPIKASYARHGQASEHAQTQYHRALLSKHPGRVQIIKGFHVFEPTTLPVYEQGVMPDKTKGVRVWVIEEKQTDVNIALHGYRDAVQGRVGQVVVCSNDSDLEGALRLIRADAPQVKIGLVMPLREGAQTDGKVPNKRLTALADWVRHHIRDEELQAAQLPLIVPTKKKPAIKPAHW